LILSGAGEVKAEKRVQSTGIGVILNEDVASARDRALKKAFENALQELIAGLYPFADITNFDRAVKEVLATDPLEFIDRYRILLDSREENLYKVEVEAWVSEDKVNRRLSEAGLIRYEGKVLKLGILIRSRTDDADLERLFTEGNPDLTSFAARQYRMRGFEVSDGPVSVDQDAKGFEKLRVNNQLTAMQGRRLGADAIVLGQVEISGDRDRELTSRPDGYHVSLWVRGVRSSDAALLGIREKEMFIKSDTSDAMVLQLIRQDLDSLLAALGSDIRKNLEEKTP